LNSFIFLYFSAINIQLSYLIRKIWWYHLICLYIVLMIILFDFNIGDNFILVFVIHFVRRYRLFKIHIFILFNILYFHILYFFKKDIIFIHESKALCYSKVIAFFWFLLRTLKIHAQNQGSYFLPLFKKLASHLLVIWRIQEI